VSSDIHSDRRELRYSDNPKYYPSSITSRIGIGIVGNVRGKFSAIADPTLEGLYSGRGQGNDVQWHSYSVLLFTVGPLVKRNSKNTTKLVFY
jgi:hypothetical protein